MQMPRKSVIGLILLGFLLAGAGTADAAKLELIVGSYRCVQTLADGGSVHSELLMQGTGGLLPSDGFGLHDSTRQVGIGAGCPEVTDAFVKRAEGLGCTASPVRLITAPPDQPETGTFSLSFSCEGGRNPLVRVLSELTREFLTALSS